MVFSRSVAIRPCLSGFGAGGERKVGTDRVVFPSPAFDQDLGIPERFEDLSFQQFVTKLVYSFGPKFQLRKWSPATRADRGVNQPDRARCAFLCDIAFLHQCPQMSHNAIGRFEVHSRCDLANRWRPLMFSHELLDHAHQLTLPVRNRPGVFCCDWLDTLDRLLCWFLLAHFCASNPRAGH